MCDNCGQPFLNPLHICDDKSDVDDDDNKSTCENTSSPGEEILDFEACKDIVFSEMLSYHEKEQVLQRNCLSLLQVAPFNFELAKYCFSHSKIFQLKKDNHSLGLSLQYLVSIFDEEFKKEVSKHNV